MHVLFVDDDEFVSQSVATALRSKGHVVDTAELGADALALIEKASYDLVVLDVGLPDMDGYHIVRRMKMDEIKTPVLMQSGLEGDDLVEDAETLGVEGILAKPFSIRQLLEHMESIFARSNASEPAAAAEGDLAAAPRRVARPARQSAPEPDPDRQAVSQPIPKADPDPPPQVAPTTGRALRRALMANDDPAPDSKPKLRAAPPRIPEPDPDSASEPGPAPVREPVVQAVPEPNAEPRPASDTQPVAEPEVQTAPAPVPDAVWEPRLEPSPEPLKLGAPAPVTAPAPERQSEPGSAVGAVPPPHETAANVGDEAAASGSDERRASKRAATVEAALITEDGKIMACVILDLSEEGAQVKLAEPELDCPDAFTLQQLNGPEIRCEVRWRSGAHLGLKFI